MYRAVTGELFTETVMGVAKGYPEINLEIVTTSVISQRIISKPQSLGVIVAESVCGEFFGSVLTGLVGSRGMIARSCYGKRYAVFDPGSRKIYHIIAGKGIVNPTSMIMCGVRLLEFFGLNDYAVWIKQAVFETINEDRIHTPDIGGKHSTCDYISNMLSRMAKNAHAHTIIHRPDVRPGIQPPSQPTAPFDPKLHMPQLAGVNLFTKKPTLGS
ncbi:isocitrate dehydrogenase [NAD] subunit 1, mitochondrial [Nilaparvata lugens]|uniref:isocitrate dehydrogenase [NAD] subunit 1, mitochondrial n=1 Tax=Nilaparvata lugens TaxID=108931 RepID=UPI000B97D791|nr:isocitrate dehydrogenase [NAD] subunit 1, mitochondrial [Nilaparvata lugens]